MAGRDAEFVINLRRNNLNTPWGFRLQGGNEFGTYLSVQRVFNGSPADGQLQRGDIIVAVNNEDVTQWHQNQAQDLIQSIGLTLALVVTRGGSVPYADSRQPQSQSQSVPSFVRKPLGQQPPPPLQHHHHQQQQQPLSPQMTSKTTIQFQPSPYSPVQPSNDFENIRPYAGVTWTPQPATAPANSFSAPLQVRTAQPSPKPYSFSPQRNDSFSQDQGDRTFQPSARPGQSHYQQDHVGGGRAPHGRDAHQRESVHLTQQSNYDDSNHVSPGRNQNAEGPAHDNRNERSYYEERNEDGEEGDDYQQMSVRDIKQMFNKPDKKGFKAVSRGQKPQKLWTRPTEGPTSPGGYSALGPRPGQPSGLAPRKPTTGSIRRGPSPSDDDFHKPYSPQPQSNYAQPRYESPSGYGAEQKSAINKIGGAYAGIVQPTLPAKTPPSKPGQKGAQKKKDFDPNQSAVYKILQEEEERAKNQPQQKEEDEEETSRRPAQGQRQGQAPRHPQPPKQAQGSRLTELLERDAAQIAPYKEKPKSAYQEHVMPYHEPKSTYQEPKSTYQEPKSTYQEPRSPTHQESVQSHQLYRGGPPPSRGGQGARQNQPSHYAYPSAFPQTQYVDGIPTSDF